MITSTILIGALSVLAGDDKTVMPPVYALRVGRAETVASGSIENAVILVEEGKITVVGEDLPIGRGIPTFDRPGWVATPGFVNCYSAVGVYSRGSSSSAPQIMASDEFGPTTGAVLGALAEYGVTTLAIHPSGTGISGQAVAVRAGPIGSELILRDSVYLKIQLRSSAKSKKMVMDGFEKADEHGEKVEKAREKWEKDLEKAKKKKKKDDDEDKEEDEEDKVPEHFTPPAADEKVQPFLDLRSGELSAMIDISKAADYLHWLDALGEEEITFALHCNLRNDIDLYEVIDRLGEGGARVILSPEITLQPFTRRERNLPAEVVSAGAALALVPRSDGTHATWRADVGHLIRTGLDQEVALRAMTLEPAEVLGLGERLGSIEAGKDANLVLLDGEPFAPGTKIQMVLLEGQNVYEYEAPSTGGEDQ